MEHITSRKNRIITQLRTLSADGAYRREAGEFVCDGEKTLKEALANGAEVTTILWGDRPSFTVAESVNQYSCPTELMQFVSSLKNSQGPVFSVKVPHRDVCPATISSAIVLENVQDPGNVGTVIRTAAAMGIDAVILVGDCADLYNPKTVRATMGGIFRQTVFEMDLQGLLYYVNQNGLRLYGAALSVDAQDIRKVEMNNLAVAVGSEGCGLSEQMLVHCAGRLIIPMEPDCESLNAAVAASIIMWEMARKQ